MPKINGIEMCRKLQNYPFRKILLTGKADNKIAVSAFNEGVIDKFIQKGSVGMVKSVDNAVDIAKSAFFKKHSDPFIAALSAETKTILNEDEFFPLFKKIIKSKRIIEYYLIDKFGSFLMLDEDANCFFLIVRTESEMNQFCDIAIGNHAPSTIVDLLKNRKKIPVFLLDEEHKLPTSKWNSYLHDVKQFNGKNIFYYSIIENMETKYIEKNKIRSYKKFKDSFVKDV